jgi:hypothetical protein
VAIGMSKMIWKTATSMRWEDNNTADFNSTDVEAQAAQISAQTKRVLDMGLSENFPEMIQAGRMAWANSMIRQQTLVEHFGKDLISDKATGNLKGVTPADAGKFDPQLLHAEFPANSRFPTTLSKIIDGLQNSMEQSKAAVSKELGTYWGAVSHIVGTATYSEEETVQVRIKICW